MSQYKTLDAYMVEDSTGRIIREVEKARYILNDIVEFFGCADSRRAREEALHDIRDHYSEIYAKLSVVEDMLDNITALAKPMDEAAQKAVEA